jgi:hypothetical protein
MKRLVIRGSARGYSQLWTADGAECASDRVYKGYLSLFAAAPQMLEALELAAACELPPEVAQAVAEAIAKAKANP